MSDQDRIPFEIGEYEITEAMIRYGGSFAQALGRLIRAADDENKRRAIAAFPELVAQYREIAVKKL